MFDAYVLKARIAPAVIAGVPPFLLFGSSIVRLDGEGAAIGLILGACGVLVCALVRDRGLRLQSSLWASWGGPPTTRRLRWRQGDAAVVSRRHRQVESVAGGALPAAAEEEVDPALADRRYSDAVGILRERTRGDQFAPLASENAEYGFRRNCLGIRPIALAVSAVVGAASLVLALAGGAGRFWVDVGISLVWVLGWSTIVSPGWVRAAAERYADRLFEAVAGLAVDRDRP